jgi:peroxiredoxin
MRFTIVVCSVLFLYACGNKRMANSIFGRLDNAANSWIYLQQISEKGDVTIDSVQTTGKGDFEMKNPATSPEFYLLRTNPTNLIFLVLRENESVEIHGDAKNFENTYQVKGSRDSELIKALRKQDRTLSDSLNGVFEKHNQDDPRTRDSVGAILQEFYIKQMEAFSKNFIKDNLRSLVSLSATKYIDQNKDAALLTELRDTLINELPGNKYVAEYDRLVKQLSFLPPGSPAPDIALENPEGKKISLSSYRGKVVLIDFWASWCAPCRKENPNLVKLYERFKGNDFEIFGVSLDENVASWKNAIAKDGIRWPQVSDLKRWDSRVINDYQFSAIPYNVLIDRDGKVISKGISAEELEMKVAEALRK